MNRLLVTRGDGKFIETEYECPPVGLTDIKVRSIMTGVCRSDIDMMVGNFGPLPDSMSGHEGLGEVIQVGPSVSDVSVGDIVATRGEPAYADEYISRSMTYIKVPYADSKYILEPVACGVNIVYQTLATVKHEKERSNVLIMGTGFLAYVARVTLSKLCSNLNSVEMVGSHNKEFWRDRGVQIQSTPLWNEYDIIIDLTAKGDVFQKNLLAPGGLLVLAAEKHPEVSTTFAHLLWNSATVVCPSPRYHAFSTAMRYARDWVTSGELKVDSFWTKSYDRNTEWQQAFADGLNRPEGYSRGYIKW